MSCRVHPVLSLVLLNFYLLQSVSPQVLLPVVSSLTSTSSLGFPVSSLGQGQLGTLLNYGLLVLLLLAMSNSLFCFSLHDVLMGQ